MKFGKYLLVTTAAFAAMPAGAASVTYNISGTNGAALPISAVVTLTTGANQVIIDAYNTIVDPKAVNQNIAGISFVLSSGQTSGSITSQTNNTSRDITDNGAGDYTDNTLFTSQWGTLANSLIAGGITACVISASGNACSETANQAEQTIVGLPNASNAYASGKGSIAANAAHNPFLFGSAADPVRFVLTVAGVTENSTFTGFQINFGTALEYAFVCTPPNLCGPPDRRVPEPGTLALLGLGLLGLGVGRRKSA